MLRAGLATAVALAVLVPADAGAATPRKRAANIAMNGENRVAAPRVPPYSERTDVRQFVQQMVERNGFGEDDLLRMFGEARYSDTVVRLISPPSAAFKRSWAAYRGRFLDPIRIREGQRFWRDHDETVRRASEQYGVPEEIIVSIIGVETIYGRITGDFRVVDALTTLAFDYPRRADYFRSELEQYLLLAREGNFDPLSVRGSFAGAIGIPQFMPGSIRRFATDFDGDGTIDLRRPTDAVGSVARFLAEHGWRRGEPTHFSVTLSDEQRAMPLIEAGIEPKYRIAELEPYGVGSPDAVPGDLPLALIDLPNADAPTSYYLGAPNFYVITRYNRSSFYAMAVIELARVLREGRR